jgi:hypothetical protein
LTAGSTRARPEALRALLQPYPDGEMAARPVSRLVNDVRRDDPNCIESMTGLRLMVVPILLGTLEPIRLAS